MIFEARARAQALVELALCLPVILVLLLGLVDLGRALAMAVSIQAAVGSAAHLGALQFTSNGSNVTNQTIFQRLIDSSQPFLNGCTASNVSSMSCSSGYGTWTLSVAYTPTRAAGNTIEVKAVGQISLFVGFLSGAFNPGLASVTVQGDAQSILV